MREFALIKPLVMTLQSEWFADEVNKFWFYTEYWQRQYMWERWLARGRGYPDNEILNPYLDESSNYHPFVLSQSEFIEAGRSTQWFQVIKKKPYRWEYPLDDYPPHWYSVYTEELAGPLTWIRDRFWGCHPKAWGGPADVIYDLYMSPINFANNAWKFIIYIPYNLRCAWNPKFKEYNIVYVNKEDYVLNLQKFSPLEWEITPLAFGFTEFLSSEQLIYQLFGGLAVSGILEYVFLEAAISASEWATQEPVFRGEGTPVVYACLACAFTLNYWMTYGPFTIEV